MTIMAAERKFPIYGMFYRLFCILQQLRITEEKEWENFDSGYDEGYEDGYKAGLEEGYIEGYNQGLEE